MKAASFSEYLRLKEREGRESKIEFRALLREKYKHWPRGDQLATEEIRMEAAYLERGFELAAEKLRVKPHQLQYRILKKGRQGWFGRIGFRPYEIAFSVAPRPNPFFDKEDQTPRDRNGYAELDVNRRGKFLIVHPPLGKGQRVTAKDVSDMLSIKGIEGVSEDMIQKQVKKSDATPYRIGEWIPDPEKDGTVAARISSDEMSAHVTLISPFKDGRYPDKEDIFKAFEARGVVFGIDEKAIDRAVAKKILDLPLSLARGRPVRHGRDAEIEPRVELSPSFSPQEEKGRINWKEMNNIVTVQRGTVLAEKRLPTPGEAGKTVTANEIPPEPGKDVELIGGSHTEVVSGGLLLKATENGHVIEEEGVLAVKPVYVVKGDVGPETGNIVHMGSVDIQGSVLDGYQIKSGGHVHILHSVGACIIEAAGNIIMKQGVNGKNRGRLYSLGGNIICKFIQSCFVQANKSIYCQEAILHSTVQANDSVIMRGTKARIVGGLIQAYREVQAKIIGSEANIKTQVEVGVMPFVRTNLIHIEEIIGNLKSKITTLQLDMAAMQRQHLDEEKQRKLEMVKKELREHQEQLEKNQDKQVEIEKMIINSPEEGKITVFKKLFSGVMMKCNTGFLENKRDLSSSYYTVDPKRKEYVKYYPLKTFLGRRLRDTTVWMNKSDEE